MKKDTYYFSHDYNARNDRKLVKLRLKMKMEAVGIYWCLVEMLYEEGGSISLSEVPVMAAEWKVKEDAILRVINDFELFESDGESFWSLSVDRRLEHRNEKSQKARENVKKRWENTRRMQSNYDGNTDVLRAEEGRNTLKESKGKEIKGKESKEGGVGETPASPSSPGAGTKMDKAKEFYRGEIESAAGAADMNPDMLDAYRTMANYLFGVNPTKTVYRNILSLPEQVSFAQFQKMEETSKETGVDPVSLFDEMENWAPLTKKNKSVHLTCVNWMRRDTKAKRV